MVEAWKMEVRDIPMAGTIILLAAEKPTPSVVERVCRVDGPISEHWFSTHSHPSSIPLQLVTQIASSPESHSSSPAVILSPH